MSLRSFFRYVEGFNKRREYDKELAFQIAACQTAELMNIIGAANTKKGQWKTLQPQKLLNAWTGNTAKDIDERRARLKRARERHEARLKREKDRKATSHNVV